jgi:hypothetical protein
MIYSDDDDEDEEIWTLKYSVVSLIAKKYLSIVAISCERLFSEAGTIIPMKRNRLSPERLNQLIFLN